MFRSSHLLVLLALLSTRVSGAPCCGGGSLLPTLITGDDRAMMGLGLAYESVRSSSFDDGLMYVKESSEAESLATFTARGVYLVGESFQIGAELPIVRRQKTLAGRDESATGIGDAALLAAVEVLPETLHSAWRPKGYVFAKVTAPTGRSTYENLDAPTAAVFGKGFWQSALGVVLVKIRSNWDFTLSGEAHWIAPREYLTTGLTTRYGSAWGASALLGAGWSPLGGNLRLGLSLAPSWETGRRIESDVDTSQSSGKSLWTSSLSASYRFNDEWAASMIYSDQTWLLSYNSDLNRSLSLLLQHNIPL